MQFVGGRGVAQQFRFCDLQPSPPPGSLAKRLWTRVVITGSTPRFWLQLLGPQRRQIGCSTILLHMVRRKLSTGALDGVRAIAIMHIVLGHHAIYTGFFRNQPPQPAEAATRVCSQLWCTSPGDDCWAGSRYEPCLCMRGTARETGQTFEVDATGAIYHEYTCCTNANASNVGESCGTHSALSPDDLLYRTTSGFDLVGGASMGLFYMISGVVLMLGYGRYGRAAQGDCCSSCDRGGCVTCCCGEGEGLQPAGTAQRQEGCDRRGCCLGCFCVFPGSEEVALPPPPPPPPLNVRLFYWKRFARLGPLWYLGNVLALPLVFTNYTQDATAWSFWIGFAISLPPLGLNAWALPFFFPPAG